MVIAPEVLYQQHNQLVPVQEIEYLHELVDAEDFATASEARLFLLELSHFRGDFIGALHLYLHLNEFVATHGLADRTAVFDPDATASSDPYEENKAWEEVEETDEVDEHWVVLLGLPQKTSFDMTTRINPFKTAIEVAFNWDERTISHLTEKDYFTAVGRLPKTTISSICHLLKAAHPQDFERVRETMALLLCLTACATNIRKSDDHRHFRWLANEVMTNNRPDQTFKDAIDNYH